MALADDLKDYIARNSTSATVIREKHNVVIVGETHAFLKTTDSEIRTKAAVRLLLELLADVNCKYFANESYTNKGKIRSGVDDYLRTKTLPPVFDPNRQTWTSRRSANACWCAVICRSPTSSGRTRATS